MEFEQLLAITLYSSGFTFFCTVLGSAIVFFLIKSKSLVFTQLSLGFSAGIMLAASFFSLLLPAIEASDYEGSLRLLPVVLGFSLGVLFLISIDKSLPHLHLLSSDPEGPKSTFSKHTLMFLAITIHNIPEGMAVGVSAAAAGASNILGSATAVLALGIGIQNIPEGAAVSMPYFADGMKRTRAFALGALSGITEPVAAVVVIFIAQSVAPLLSWFLSFAAGSMMYVVVEELIPQSHDMGHSDKGTLCVLLGFITMMVLDVSLS